MLLTNNNVKYSFMDPLLFLTLQRREELKAKTWLVADLTFKAHMFNLKTVRDAAPSNALLLSTQRMKNVETFWSMEN